MPGPVCILIETQLAENLGGVARALANFSISDLRLVNPHVDLSDPKARACASHGLSVLKNARIFKNLKDAAYDRSRLIGTTAYEHDMIQKYISPKAIIWDASLALVFGPERTGLSNNDLSLCSEVTSIPVNPECRSLNLVQAVSILFYESFTRVEPSAHLHYGKTHLASFQDVENFLNHLELNLDHVNFWRVPEKKQRMKRMLSTMFHRFGMTEQELKTLHGVISSMTVENEPKTP